MFIDISQPVGTFPKFILFNTSVRKYYNIIIFITDNISFLPIL